MYYKHGNSNRPEYKCWVQIKARCLNPGHSAYADYGGRGIDVDPAWVNDFEAFFAEVGERPTSKHSLDRIENDKGYISGNCRWATSIEQNNNRRPHSPWGSRVKRVPTGVVTCWKHGMIKTPEYRSWDAMKTRCLNTNNDNYPHWGGKGVTVYEPWIHDFKAFYDHIGPRPSPQHTLDRYPNPDGNYEPGNVRWASKREQNLNRRPTVTGPEHGNTEHGRAGSPEYQSWGSIKTRCFNSKHDGYARYGALGITMCSRWKEDFKAFFQDLGKKPSKEYRVGRVNVSGNYSCGSCPECLEKGWIRNCQWSTVTEQNRNRRSGARSGKLNTEKVAQIREKLATGVNYKDLAKEYGIGLSLVQKIQSGKSWV